MRALLVLAIAAIQISPAYAAEDRLCFTEESKAQAQQVLGAYVHPHRAARERDGTVQLACEVQANERLVCSVAGGTESALWRDAALAYVAELQACPASPRQFSMPIHFDFEDD